MTDVVAEEVTLDAPPLVNPAASPQVILTRRFVFALTILLGCFAGLGPLAIDMYLPSFGAISAEFGATNQQVERTLTAYFFGLALGQLFYGPAADRYGRKPPMYVGLVLFILASIGCSFATSVRSLVLLRTVQAIGGCAEMVIARAIVRDLFDDKAAVRVFSSLVLVMGVAPVVAPLIGGAVATHLGWRAVFYILAGAGVLCLLGAMFLLPESLPPERRQSHSIVKTLQLYQRLFTHRIFLVHAITIGLLCSALFAYVGGAPHLFMETYHIPANHFWWFFGPNAVSLIGMSQVNGYLAQRIDPRKILRVALAVSITVSILLLVVTTTSLASLWTIDACLFVFLGTCGFIFPNATVIAMSPHGANAGNASALLGCLQFLISAIGGLVVTNLPFTGPVAMAVCIAGCMVLIPVVRVSAKYLMPG